MLISALDKSGRVIGIHGLAEGENAIDSQNGSETSIQLGYSLGVPISTFLGLQDRFKITSQLLVQDNSPTALNPTEKEAFETAILGTEIPQGNTSAKRWLERGNQLWRLERYEEAVQAFDQAIKLDPEFIHLAHYGKGLALAYQSQYELALASLEQATNIQPDFASAFYTKCLVLRELNQLEDALIAIDHTIALEPQNAKWHFQKGFILEELKRYSAAEVAYTNAIEINSRAGFYNNRGNLYSDQLVIRVCRVLTNILHSVMRSEDYGSHYRLTFP